MKNFFLLFIAGLLFHCICYAQIKAKLQIDSLLAKIARTKEDTAKVNLYRDIMNACVYYNPKEGLTYQAIALDVAKKTGSQMCIAKIKEGIGRLNWRMGNFSEALKNHFEAYDIFVGMGNNYKNHLLVEISQDYLDDGKFTQAEYYLLKALELSKEAGDKKNMLSTYDILLCLYSLQGNNAEMTKTRYAYLKLCEETGDKELMMLASYSSAVYFESIGNNTESFNYFKKALKAAKENGEKISEAHYNVCVGSLYIKIGNNTEASIYYLTALKLANESGDAELLANVHQGMGDLFNAERNYKDAIRNYLMAVGKYKLVNDRERLAIVYCQMGITYTNNKKYPQAKKSFDNAKVIYEYLNTRLVSMGDYYAGREMLDSATADWKSAYQDHKKFIQTRDSAFNKEALEKLVTTQMKYEADKKDVIAKTTQEKKDIITKAAIVKERNIRNATFSVLVLVLIFSVVVIRQRNKIAREKKRSDQLLTDNELLLKEIHHRVKNNLEVVSSLLELQSAQVDDPHTKNAMREGQNRVHSIGIVHQKLYQGTNLNAIEMKDYFINLSESILDSFGAEKRVTIECAMDQLDVDIDTAVPLGLIVNELLTNTLKYAFPGGQQGSVQIKLQKQVDGLLQLQVSDNGIGKSTITQGTGFGGQLVALLTQQLGGSMREEIKNGTSIYFEFRPTKAA